MQNLLKVEVEGLSRLEVQDIYRISGLYPSLYFESDNDFNVKINQGIQKLWEIERFADPINALLMTPPHRSKSCLISDQTFSLI